MPVVSLTSAYVKALKPPVTGRVEVWDEKTPGLCLRLSASGAASWSFRYRPREAAGYERITLGGLDALTLADARDRVARMRGTVVDGGNPQRDRRERREAARTVLTFDALAQRYLDDYAKPRKASWRTDELQLNRPRAAWGDKPAESVTRRDVVALLDTIARTAPVSANRTHSILVTLFRWAADGELVPANPAAGLKKRAKETAKERTLTEPELRALWLALGKTDAVTKDIADALRFLVLTGQRPGEVAGAMTGELVALDRTHDARWEIPAARMKARRAHAVPLPPMALALLTEVLARRKVDGAEEPAGAGAVFASKFTSRTTLARHSLSQGLARIVGKLEAKGPDAEAITSLQARPPTPHDLRRTLATGLAALGVLREDRMAVLAHVEGDVHGVHYDRHERLREKRVALETWERHLARVIGLAPATANVVPIRRRGRK